MTTHLARLRRTLASLLSVLLLASGLALLPAALVSPSTAGGSVSANCTQLKSRIAKAEDRVAKKKRIANDRGVQRAEASERYQRNRTQANLRKFKQAEKRYVAAVRAVEKAEKQVTKAKKNYKRKCTGVDG